MTTRRDPMILRLPFALADRKLRLEQILASDAARPWAKSRQLLPRFALSRPELQFARRLLEQKRNLWLYRCSQRSFCGDFVAVDMSPARPWLRPAVVIELKSRAPLRFGGAGAGWQLRRAREVVTELADREGVISTGVPVMLVCGAATDVFRWIIVRGIGPPSAEGGRPGRGQTSHQSLS